MEVRVASRPAPGRSGDDANEDVGFALPGLACVLDGVSVFPGMETGCVHGPAWYVRRLEKHLGHAYGPGPDAPLADLLAGSIERVNADHGGRCDLTHPGTPASTVAMLRQRDGRLDYLVLCDSSIVVEHGDDLTVVVDGRFAAAVADLHTTAPAALDSAERAEHFIRARAKQLERANRPDGYWIAAANPHAAHEAVTGSFDLRGPQRASRAALLTDGASRAVDEFELFDWRGLLNLLTDEGPDALIDRVRAAETVDCDGHWWSRYKRHDDATVAFCLFEQSQ
jgi:hypothetical protein